VSPTADDKAANEMLHGGPGPLSAILGAITNRQPGPDGVKAQEHAAGCLLLAGRNLKTRESLINGGNIDSKSSQEFFNNGLVDNEVIPVDFQE